MINILKNEKLNNIVSISKCIFLCIFTFYLITREILALNRFIDSLYIIGFFFGMSVLYIGFDLLTNRFCLKTRYLPAAILFLAVTVISCFLNREYGVFSNIKGLATLFIYLFLLYPEAFESKSAQTISACFNTAFFTLAFYSAVSLVMYYYGVDYYTSITLKHQGFDGNAGRLWGVYQDPNYLALYSLIAIFSSVYLFVKTKSIFKKIILVLFDLIHFTVVSMTGSRMGIVCIIAALIWIGIIIVFKKLNLKPLKRILAFIIATVIAIGLPLAAREAVNHGMPFIKKAVIHAGSAETYMNVHKFFDKVYEYGDIKMAAGTHEGIDISQFPFDEENTPIDRIEENTDVSNGRFGRWIDGLKLIAQKPFFGISPRNIFSFADTLDIETAMAEDDYIHNTYLEIFAGAGIIGGIFVLGFLILAAVYILKISLKFTPNIKMITCTTLIMIIAISAVLLPDIIFFQLTFAGQTFWLSLGQCLNTNEENYKTSFSYKLLNKCFKRKSDI